MLRAAPINRFETLVAQNPRMISETLWKALLVLLVISEAAKAKCMREQDWFVRYGYSDCLRRNQSL